MSFKVTIEQTEEVERFKSSGYELLKTVHCNSDTEYEELHSDYREEYKRNADGTYTRQVFGYAPKTEVTEKVVTKVYEQVVEQLDISGVIAKINSASDPRVPVLAKRADRD